MKYSLFVVVVVGVGKGLGSVKETISSIQELGKRRERESVLTSMCLWSSVHVHTAIFFG